MGHIHIYKRRYALIMGISLMQMKLSSSMIDQSMENSIGWNRRNWNPGGEEHLGEWIQKSRSDKLV